MTEAAATMRRPRPRPNLDEAPVEDDTSAPAAQEPTSDQAEGEAILRSLVGGWSEGQRQMDATSSYAQALKPDKTMQFIKFLSNAPYANYRRHWIERTGENGKTKRPYVCLQTVGKRCPLCDIGDRPQAVSAFNVALLGDEGQVDLKSWDVGGKLFNTLKSFNDDPRMGPLTKGYFAVNKSTGKGGTTSVNASVVSEYDAENTYNLKVPTPEQLAAIKQYDASIIEIPKVSDLQELADEMSNED